MYILLSLLSVHVKILKLYHTSKYNGTMRTGNTHHLQKTHF